MPVAMTGAYRINISQGTTERAIMSITKWILDQPDYTNIVDSAYQAVHDSVTAANGEVDVVAVLCHNIPETFSQLPPLRGASISVGSVFVHGTPKVKWDGMSRSRIEIGDLLLLQNTHYRNTISKRALLLQAKRGAIPATPDENQDQWDLYYRWPRFEYSHSRPELNEQEREILEPDMYDAAQYLLINQDYRGNAPIHRFYYYHSNCAAYTAHPTKTKLSRYQCFAMQLSDFILDDAGKPYDDPADGDIGWNKVIDDLTRIISLRTSRIMRRNSNGNSGSRGQGMNMGFIAGNPSAFDSLSALNKSDSGEPPSSRLDQQEGDENSGIPVIMFDIKVDKYMD